MKRSLVVIALLSVFGAELLAGLDSKKAPVRRRHDSRITGEDGRCALNAVGHGADVHA